MDKLSQLKSILKSYGSTLIAFSGGVDSTFLLKVAIDTLGRKNAIAVTAKSKIYPEEELEESKKLARLVGARQVILNTSEIDIPGYKDNPPNRCYFCKSELFSRLKRIAKSKGTKVVCDGSNRDDRKDYRPGSRAVKELGVKSPLDEAGFTKDDIRKFSRKLGLPSWDKPSFACLASRFPYGEAITEDKLRLIARGENALRDLGFKQVRLRYHGNIARVEVAKDELSTFAKPELRDRVSKALKSLGFLYVALDLDGYRTGSMNEALKSHSS
ncbi:MAG: ATP-dependent sacrificial sulfur transferase LarE [Candidatus Omnitrophica bacterium]|nr:ATP-dependent sacrificial sulfur transferase LarE [Candidatus Omnitrophota bacterium]